MKILCTLGPSSLNKKFLSFAKNKVSLLRLNLSHIDLLDLTKKIKFIKKYSNIPICIDTEGAQIRTKVLKEKNFNKNEIIKVKKNSIKFSFYPEEVNDKLKVNDELDIGFLGLKLKITKINKKEITYKVTKGGKLENNKGVHLCNRKINLNYLTKKDYDAIKIAKKNKINYFALSFTNSTKDIINFKKLLKKEKKIYKIETKNALNSIEKIINEGEEFLIDRGDLSKDIDIELIPVAQRKIIKAAREKRKKVYVATNFLESMILNNFSTRGELNDIYSTLEMGADGLVLAGETAVGKNPIECVKILKKVSNIYKKFGKNFKR